MANTTSPTSPAIRLERVHVRGLRSIKELSLPEAGMGWDGHFPPVAVLGGANGSGKTTLLNMLAHAGRLLADSPAYLPDEVAADECLLDWVVCDGAADAVSFRFVVGKKSFVDANASANCWGYIVTGARPKTIQRGEVVELRRLLRDPARFAASRLPRLVFLPSDRRDLVVPNVSYKSPGKLSDEAGFVAVWDRPRDEQWNGSTVELLFSARWADLNAKEQDRPEEAKNFELYTKSFADLTNGAKQLGWTSRGDLVVEIADGTSHAVEGLSAGERQAVLLLAELRRLWRPGSLVFIDELELHLHDAWQGKLYENVVAMQRELGGQVIITTQSHSLFEMAENGTQMLLGRCALR